MSIISVQYGSSSVIFSGSKPLIQWEESVQFDGAGNRQSSLVDLTLNGTALASGLGGSLSGVFFQINQLRNEFSQDYKLFVVKEDSQILASGFPKINNYSFDQGVWYNSVKYQISLSYPIVVSDSFGSGVDSFSNEWNYNERQDGNLEISHEISAKGRPTYISGAELTSAFINAKDFVLNLAGSGVQPTGAPFFTSLVTNGQFFLDSKSERINVLDGTYSISENFINSSGAYTESYTLQGQKDENSIISISINGEIQGLGQRGARYNSAVSGWENTVSGLIYPRSTGFYSTFGGVFTLNTTPISTSFTSDTINGTISYSRSFSDEKIISLPSGVVDFQISVSDNPVFDIFASIAIPGRTSGNIVQNMLTPTEFTRSVNGFMRVDRAAISGGLSGAKLATQFIKNELNKFYRPSGNSRTDIHVTSANFSEREEINQTDFSCGWAAIQPRNTGDASLII